MQAHDSSNQFKQPVESAHILSLQSFLVALAQLDTGLSDELHQDIYQIGEQLIQDPSGAVANIPAVVNRCDRLRELYETHHADLEKRYQNQGQALDTVLEEGTMRPEVPWEQEIASTLTASNPITAARSMIKRTVMRLTPSQPLSEMATLLVPLFRTAQKIDAQEMSVLRALEYRPLTVEDLAYAVGLSVEQVKGIVASLWQSGYVDASSGRLLHRVFPSLKRSQPQPPAPNSDTAFTLTMRGHFRLHPLLRGRTLRGAAS